MEVTLLLPSQHFLGEMDRVMPSVSHSADTPESLGCTWSQMSAHPWTREPSWDSRSRHRNGQLRCGVMTKQPGQ